MSNQSLSRDFLTVPSVEVEVVAQWTDYVDVKVPSSNVPLIGL